MGRIESTGQTEQSIRALLKTQKLAVLSTQSDGQPYASLVAFVASEDLKQLYFSTARSTRKYHNLVVDPKVAMLIDNRSNQDSDFHAAAAVTATGTAAEVPEHEKGRIIKLYLSRHPYLQDFVLAESCAVIGVAVRTYYLVTRFQQVMELHIKP